MRRLQIRNVQAQPMPWFDEEANRKGSLITNSQHVPDEPQKYAPHWRLGLSNEITPRDSSVPDTRPPATSNLGKALRL